MPYIPWLMRHLAQKAYVQKPCEAYPVPNLERLVPWQIQAIETSKTPLGPAALVLLGMGVQEAVTLDGMQDYLELAINELADLVCLGDKEWVSSNEMARRLFLLARERVVLQFPLSRSSNVVRLAWRL